MGKTGPKTTEGKRAVAANSTTHGILSSQLLKCRKDKCFYYECCVIKDEVVGMPYGFHCPEEAYRYEELVKQYSKDFGIEEGDKKHHLIKELAMADIQGYRCDRAIEIGGHQMLREIRVGVSAEGQPLTRTEIHQLYRYKMEILRYKAKLIGKLMTYKEEEPCPDESDTSTQMAN